MGEDNLEGSGAPSGKLELLEEYFKPASNVGEETYENLPLHPLYNHERLVLSAWISLAEKGEADSAFSQNLTELFKTISSQERVHEEKTERTTFPPPLLLDEGRSIARGALDSFNNLGFLKQKGSQEIIRKSLRLAVELMLKSGLLKMENEEENRIDYLKRVEGEISQNASGELPNL